MKTFRVELSFMALKQSAEHYSNSDKKSRPQGFILFLYLLTINK